MTPEEKHHFLQSALVDGINTRQELSNMLKGVAFSNFTSDVTK